MGERVRYEWSNYDTTARINVKSVQHGEVIHWMVVPNEEATGPYGEGRPITYHNPCAVVKADDGSFKVLRVEHLHHADIKEGSSA